MAPVPHPKSTNLTTLPFFHFFLISEIAFSTRYSVQNRGMRTGGFTVSINYLNGHYPIRYCMGQCDLLAFSSLIAYRLCITYITSCLHFPSPHFLPSLQYLCPCSLNGVIDEYSYRGLCFWNLFLIIITLARVMSLIKGEMLFNLRSCLCKDMVAGNIYQSSELIYLFSAFFPLCFDKILMTMCRGKNCYGIWWGFGLRNGRVWLGFFDEGIICPCVGFDCKE